MTSASSVVEPPATTHGLVAGYVDRAGAEGRAERLLNPAPILGWRWCRIAERDTQLVPGVLRGLVRFGDVRPRLPFDGGDIDIGVTADVRVVRVGPLDEDAYIPGQALMCGDGVAYAFLRAVAVLLLGSMNRWTDAVAQPRFPIVCYIAQGTRRPHDGKRASARAGPIPGRSSGLGGWCRRARVPRTRPAPSWMLSAQAIALGGEVLLVLGPDAGRGRCSRPAPARGGIPYSARSPRQITEPVLRDVCARRGCRTSWAELAQVRVCR